MSLWLFNSIEPFQCMFQSILIFPTWMRASVHVCVCSCPWSNRTNHRMIMVSHLRSFFGLWVYFSSIIILIFYFSSQAHFLSHFWTNAKHLRTLRQTMDQNIVSMYKTFAWGEHCKLLLDGKESEKKLANTNIPVKFSPKSKRNGETTITIHSAAAKNSFIIVSLCQFDLQRMKTKTQSRKKVITWKDCCKQY